MKNIHLQFTLYLLMGLSSANACSGELSPAAGSSGVAVKTAVDKPVLIRHPRQKTWMKRTWGVEIEYVRRSAAGYMLEFRYKVLDPVKAAVLFDRQKKPLLTHQRTGAKMVVPTPPTTGALRNSNKPLANHVYWMFFANPGKLVKSGEQVSIEIGKFKATDIVVL